MSTAWSDNFIIAGSSIAAMIAVMLTYAVIMLGLRRLRAAGWGSLVAAGLLLSCGAGGAWLAWQIRNRFDDPFVGFIVFMLGFASIGPIAFAAIAWLLPQRRRKGGARRGGRALAAACYAAALLCLAALIGVLALPAYTGGVIQFSDLPKIVATLLALVAGLTVAGTRVRRQRRAATATEVAAADRRPPVLYLREFRYERQPFVRGDAASLKRYLQNAGRWVPWWLRPAWADVQVVSAEEYLAEAMDSQIGPFLALGGPLDELPPLGAFRDYAEDADWETRFMALAQTARAIVLIPGSSDALRWELRTLLDAGMAAKSFVLVGSDAFQSSTLWWVGRLYGWRNPDWSAFRGLLQASGYRVPPDAPRPYSVLGFDKAGRGRWLAEGTAVAPELYAAAMITHLAKPPAH